MDTNNCETQIELSEEELRNELAKKELQNMFRGYETIDVLKDQIDHLKKYIKILTKELNQLKDESVIHKANEKLYLQKIRKLEIEKFDLKKNKQYTPNIHIENVYITN